MEAKEKNALKTATIRRRTLEAAEDVLIRWKEKRKDIVDVIDTKMSLVPSVIHDGTMADNFVFTITFKLKGR